MRILERQEVFETYVLAVSKLKVSGRTVPFGTETQMFGRQDIKKDIQRSLRRSMRQGAISLLIMAGLAVSSGISTLARSYSQQQQPSYHVTMVPATIVTINYQHRSGSTTIGFQGSPLLPLARGRAKVTGKVGRIQINACLLYTSPPAKTHWAAGTAPARKTVRTRSLLPRWATLNKTSWPALSWAISRR